MNYLVRCCNSPRLLHYMSRGPYVVPSTALFQAPALSSFVEGAWATLCDHVKCVVNNCKELERLAESLLACKTQSEAKGSC